MYSVWLSEQTVPCALYIIYRLVFITEVKSVYCAVRTSPYNITHSFVLKGLKEVVVGQVLLIAT